MDDLFILLVFVAVFLGALLTIQFLLKLAETIEGHLRGIKIHNRMRNL